AVGLKQKFPFLKQVYWGTDSIWSEGYFVTTVGANESVIRKYIIRQGQEDSGQTLFE
ncbi:transposase, partial [Candidatus Nomurabacteria bacterium]|nr:transposase [Candidatus Nomurabacteria bacterium]